MNIQQQSNLKYMPQVEQGYSRLTGIKLTALIVVLTTSLLADAFLPIEIPHGMGYVLAILLSVLLSSSYRVLWTTTAIALALIVFGSWIAYLFKSEFVLVGQVISRSASAAAVLLAGMVCQLQLNARRIVRSKLHFFENARDDLIHNQRLLKLAADTVKFGGFSILLPERKLLVTDQVMDIFGQPRSKLPDLKSALNYYLPPYREQIQEAYTRCVLEGIPYDEECQILTGRNERIWIRSTGRAERDEHGQIVCVSGSVQDISSRKQMEHSLAESQTRFQSMADSLPEMVWAASRDGRLEFLNDASIGYFGMDEGTTPNNTLLKEYIHPSDRQSVTRRWLRAVRRGDDSFSAKIRLKNWQGRYDWHQLSARTHCRIEDDRPVTQWFGMATNVDNMILTQGRFKDMAHLFEKTFDSITDMLFTVGPDWTFQSLNTKAARFFGGTRQSLIGRPFFEVGVTTLGLATVQELRKVLHRSNLKPFEFYSEELDASLRCSAYSLDDGKGFVFYIQDVTEQRSLEKQLYKAQQLETLGMLTGGIAHDFNNLLTVIMGNAEMMTRKLYDEEKLAQRAQTIQLAATKGAGLVQQLLAYARKQPLHPEVVDVNQLIGDIDSLLNKSVTEAVTIKYELGGELWFANIDPFQLESALMNLCINAMQAMPTGGNILIETANETIGVDRTAAMLEFNPGDYICISVSDNGRGIPKADLGKIFEPFYTTKDTGSGLGLSMVFGFVKQSGGHVTVYSEVNQGTTFRLYLPKAAKHVNVVDIPQEKQIRYENGTEVILVVEDDDLVRDYANTVLEQAGYQVYQAENALAALCFLENHPNKIDLLFTDIIMPGGMHGTELAKRALELKPDLKVLFASGYSKSMLEFNRQADAANDHIKKPYQRSMLLTQLRSVLDTANANVMEAVAG